MDIIQQYWSNVSSGQAWLWLTSDATGQRLGLGVLLLAAVLSVWLVARFGHAIVKKLGHLPKLLMIVASAYYIAVLILKLDPVQWAPAAAVAALAVLVLGLASHARKQQGGKGGGKHKPKPA